MPPSTSTVCQTLCCVLGTQAPYSHNLCCQGTKRREAGDEIILHGKIPALQDPRFQNRGRKDGFQQKQDSEVFSQGVRLVLYPRLEKLMIKAVGMRVQVSLTANIFPMFFPFHEDIHARAK